MLHTGVPTASKLKKGFSGVHEDIFILSYMNSFSRPRRHHHLRCYMRRVSHVRNQMWQMNGGKMCVLCVFVTLIDYINLKIYITGPASQVYTHTHTCDLFHLYRIFVTTRYASAKAYAKYMWLLIYTFLLYRQIARERC